MSAANQIFQLLKKDLLLELRLQYSFYGIILYVASTTFVLFMTLGDPESNVWNGLFWVIQLFVCINAVAKSFLGESKGRMLYYYTASGPVNFILSKLLFNALLMLLLTSLTLALFILLLNNPVERFGTFLIVVLLGSLSLSLVFSFLAAIASKAQQNSAIMAILGFPIIIPQLMLLMQLSRRAFTESNPLPVEAMLLLIALDLLVILLSVILFPYLWKE